MQRQQPTAPLRIRFGTAIVAIALWLLTLGMSPAQATEGPAATSRASVQPAQIHVHAPGGPVNSTVDWQWLYGRWQIRFNWAETRQMSRGFSYCNMIAAIIPHWTARIVAAACGILWIFADSAVAQGKCVEAYVSIAPINPVSFGKWNCPT